MTTDTMPTGGPKRKRRVRVPVPAALNPINVWEHTPADYYRYGEYPRHIRPVGPRSGEHETRWELRDV